MSCQDYNNCVAEQRKSIGFPDDGNSLYAYRAYDDQTARKRCYERKPVQIVEGFGDPVIFLRILIILVIAFGALVVFCRVTGSNGHSSIDHHTAVGGTLRTIDFTVTENY